MGIGVAITVIGGFFMFWTFQATGLSFWFACSWLPFMIGVICVVLAWSSRTMRWLHVRIRQDSGERPQNIAFSLPLPLGFASGVLRMFRPWLPNNIAQLDAVLQSLNETSTDTPFYLEVDEGNGEDRVEIFIG
jgi:hypothetical protein